MSLSPINDGYKLVGRVDCLQQSLVHLVEDPLNEKLRRRVRDAALEVVRHMKGAQNTPEIRTVLTETVQCIKTLDVTGDWRKNSLIHRIMGCFIDNPNRFGNTYKCVRDAVDSLEKSLLVSEIEDNSDKGLILFRFLSLEEDQRESTILAALPLLENVRNVEQAICVYNRVLSGDIKKIAWEQPSVKSCPEVCYKYLQEDMLTNEPAKEEIKKVCSTESSSLQSPSSFKSFSNVNERVWHIHDRATSPEPTKPNRASDDENMLMNFPTIYSMLAKGYSEV